MLFLVLLVWTAFFAAYAGQREFTFSSEEACFSIGPIALKCEVGFGDLLVAAFTAALWIATWRLVSGADGTAKHQLRAYIGIEEITCQMKANVVRHRIKIKNFGLTPAYQIVTRHKAITSKNFDHDYSEIDAKKLIIGVMMPGATLLMNIENPIGSEFTKSDVHSGKAKPITWGTIRYKDAFGNQRHTGFRFYVESDEGKLQTAMMNEGNDADQ